MKTPSLYYVYLTDLQKLFEKAKTRKNPAMWLYENKARNTLFFLESLARLHMKLSDDKKILKLHKFSKKLEDLFGQLDYYLITVKQLSKHKTIKSEQKEYFEKKLSKIESKLNNRLLEKEFFLSAISNFRSVDWTLESDATITKVHSHIKRELMAGAAFFEEFSADFTNMEEQVHELRRKLRWISIYALSLQGHIALKKSTSTSLQKEWINAKAKAIPYNKIPPKNTPKHQIFYDQNAFIALNYCVEELGDIKNEGLLIKALSKALKKTVDPKPADAEALAQKILGLKTPVSGLLKQAHQLLNSFYRHHKIHQRLC